MAGESVRLENTLHRLHPTGAACAVVDHAPTAVYEDSAVVYQAPAIADPPRAIVSHAGALVWDAIASVQNAPADVRHSIATVRLPIADTSPAPAAIGYPIAPISDSKVAVRGQMPCFDVATRSLHSDASTRAAESAEDTRMTLGSWALPSRTDQATYAKRLPRRAWLWLSGFDGGDDFLRGVVESVGAE